MSECLLVAVDHASRYHILSSVNSENMSVPSLNNTSWTSQSLLQPSDQKHRHQLTYLHGHFVACHIAVYSTNDEGMTLSEIQFYGLSKYAICRKCSKSVQVCFEHICSIIMFYSEHRCQSVQSLKKFKFNKR